MMTILTLSFWSVLAISKAFAATTPPADPTLLQHAYGQEEILSFEISWLGVKAGELTIHLLPDQSVPDRYAIRVTAKSAGLLAVFYPIEDQFETIVTGPNRLPVRYSIDQHEGQRRNNKLTTYDQKQGVVTYLKNKEPVKTYQINGPTYNEFASFMIMRTLPLVIGQELMVPTFADKKRHEVMVQVEGQEEMNSIFGKIDTIRVRPQLPFKGLYKKAGDPVIWISNDPDRVPLFIKAKIVIGSLTARLVGYQGWKQVPLPSPTPPDNNDEEPFL